MYFLKLVAKYAGVLKPTISLTSVILYLPSFSSLQASEKRIFLIKSVVLSPVIAFIFKCKVERDIFISDANKSAEKTTLSRFFFTTATAFSKNSLSKAQKTKKIKTKSIHTNKNVLKLDNFLI